MSNKKITGKTRKLTRDDQEELLDLYDRLASQWARDYEALHPTD